MNNTNKIILKSSKSTQLVIFVEGGGVILVNLLCYLSDQDLFKSRCVIQYYIFHGNQSESDKG